MFTLVQGSTGSVETLYLANKRLVKNTKAAGGIVFDTREVAANAARHYNYDENPIVKATPLERGFFSTKKVSGRHIYVPRYAYE